MGYIYLQQKQHKNTAGVAVRGGAQSHGGVAPAAKGVAGEGAESYGGLNVQISLY